MTVTVSLPLPVSTAPVMTVAAVGVVLGGALVIVTPDVLADRSIAVAWLAA